MPDFKKLNLSEVILDALEKKGYVKPTPIQLQSIPHLLEGRDLLGIAQTGTGKTAAFSLPILDNLVKSNKSVKANCVRALILTPTRELASQIAENIELYGKGLGLKHAVIFGGVGEFLQIKAMEKGLDILIATPGRLLDLTSQKHVRYSQLEIFVLDEADRMLDMGFINDVKKIIAKLPEKKQSLFFSATMPEAIANLANSILDNPVKVEVTPQSTTVERINQKLNLVEKSNKPALLKSILKQDNIGSALVFCKTKHGANKVVAHLLLHSISVAAIHGNKSQSAREKALKGFRSGEIKVLVATDIAARGIDVPGISHVINYEMPNDPESYVHRIGRTARAGREGVAISFCDSSERGLLKEVERIIGMKIPVDESHPFHGVAGVASNRNEFSGVREKFTSRNKEKKFNNKNSDMKRSGSGGFDKKFRNLEEGKPREDRSEGAKPRRISSERKFSEVGRSKFKNSFSETNYGKSHTDIDSRSFARPRSNAEGYSSAANANKPRFSRQSNDARWDAANRSSKEGFSRGNFDKGVASEKKFRHFGGRPEKDSGRFGRNLGEDEKFFNPERLRNRENSNKNEFSFSESSFGSGLARTGKSSFARSSSNNRDFNSRFKSRSSSAPSSRSSFSSDSSDRRSRSVSFSGAGSSFGKVREESGQSYDRNRSRSGRDSSSFRSPREGGAFREGSRGGFRGGKGRGDKR